MPLKNIALQVEYSGLPREFVSEFAFRTRFVCNYVARRARDASLTAGPFNMIIIECVTGVVAIPNFHPKHSKVSVEFDYEFYRTLNDVTRPEYLIDLLRQGFCRCSHLQPAARHELLSYLEDFRDNGFKNEWVHKRRVLKGTGLKAQLACSLDTNLFKLALSVERKGEIIWKKVILETLPDEVCFHYEFKDVTLDGKEIVVTSHYSDRSCFRLPLLDLPREAETEEP